jgi:hypothetical protein
VNNSHDTTVMTMKAPIDVRQKLEQWATDNLTSMTAEVIRSVRERAEREREKAG